MLNTLDSPAAAVSATQVPSEFPPANVPYQSGVAQIVADGQEIALSRYALSGTV
jgi:hypothetical protein